VIYLDTSVLLAQVLAEDRVPRPSLWSERLVSSRLLEYETWTRLHALRLARSHGDAARALLQRVALVELAPLVQGRTLEPFPVPVRTLDALHLATALFLQRQGQDVEVASYDERLLAAARALALPLAAT
jgi:predicted nucleic acid-binding protein